MVVNKMYGITDETGTCHHFRVPSTIRSLLSDPPVGQGAVGGRLRLSAGSVLLFRHDLLDYRPLGKDLPCPAFWMLLVHFPRKSTV